MTTRHSRRPTRFVAGLLALGLTAALLSTGPASAEPAPEPGAPSLPTVLPNPQQISAVAGNVELRGHAQVIVGPQTDAPAKDLLVRILKDHGVSRVDVTTKPSGKAPALLLGSGDRPDIQQVLAKTEVPKQAQGYALRVQPKSGRTPAQVALGGTDATGQFYAVQTLRQLLTHDSHWKITGAAISDYPTLATRGSIEGFYGDPWTHEDRLRQLSFYGENKMDLYVYAPKDDPYHRERWREPYPAAKLSELTELVERAKKNHVNFTFAVSPGLSVCYSSDQDLEALLAKFESVYAIGIRGFNVALDDIDAGTWNCEEDKEKFGSGDAAAGAAQSYLLNRVRERLATAHDDIHPLQMVPTEYANVTDTAYKEALRTELDEKIIVEWTGVGVVAPKIAAGQSEAAHRVFGHDILLWDNYPVNDYAHDRLYLGPYTGRDTNLQDHGLIGIHANPMNQAEASKIALATVADFGWNSAAYQPAKSWDVALERFGGDAAGALRTFAENIRSTPLTDSLPESPTLTPLIEEFWEAYNAGTENAPTADLQEAFADIEQAPATLRSRLDNPEFLTETAPWLDQAAVLGSAGQTAMDLLVAQRAGDEDRAWSERRALDQLLPQVNDSAHTYAPEVARPFFDQVLKVSDAWFGLGQDSGETSLTASSTMGTYEDNSPDKMVDGSRETYYYSDAAAKVGDAIAVDLGRVRDVSGVHIAMTKSDSAKDYVHKGILEGSVDGKTWTTIAEVADEPEVSVVAPAGSKVRHLRLRVTADQKNWIVVREFSVDTPLPTTGGPPAAEGSSQGLATDRQTRTSYLAGRTPLEGEALEVEVDSSRDVAGLLVLQDGDEPATGELQVRVGGAWTTVGNLDGAYTQVDLDQGAQGLSKVESVRIRWEQGSPAPSIAEIIPWYAEASAVDLQVETEPITVGTGGLAKTDIGVTSPLPADVPGTLTLSGDGLAITPASSKIIIRRGATQKINATIKAPADATVGAHQVTVTFTPEQGDPVQATLDVDVVEGPPGERVFVSGTEGYSTFRIPAIVRSTEGTLLAFAEGRADRHDAGDIDLVLRRSTDNGLTWGPLQVVGDEGDNTFGNPAPVVDESTGDIVLLSTHNAGTAAETAIREDVVSKADSRRVYVQRSADDGQTWSDAKEITQSAKLPEWNWYATGPGHGLQLSQGAHAGRLIVASDHSASPLPGSTDSGAEDHHLGAHAVYSDDGGHTWTIGSVADPGDGVVNPNEGTAAELPDGRVYFNVRDQNGSSAPSRAVAYSSDGGSTLQEPYRPEQGLTGPAVQGSTLFRPSTGAGEGRLLFSSPADPKARKKMTVSTSTDGGTTWPEHRLIWSGPTGYSDLTPLAGGGTGLLYEAGATDGYATITFTALD